MNFYSLWFSFIHISHENENENSHKNIMWRPDGGFLCIWNATCKDANIHRMHISKMQNCIKYPK